MERPSHKELTGKIELARRLVKEKRWVPASEVKLRPNFEELDLYLPEEQENALANVREELKPEYYAGSRPPQRSREESVRGKELFAFAWMSRFFGKRIYFKFTFKGTGNVKDLYVLSIHEDRPR